MTRDNEHTQKLAKSARRKPGNEASLIWSLIGVAAFFVTFGVMKTYPTIPIRFGFSYLGFLIASGVAIGAIAAAVYYPFALKAVNIAQAEYAAVMHAAQAARDAEVKQKIADMKAKT